MSDRAPFEVSREDGRSDRTVIYELARDAEPETFYSYDQLMGALSQGLPEDVERERVYRSVSAANKTLLREDRRYLSVVRKKGYRVIRTDEHLPMALAKKDMAQTYLRKGIALLKHARLDELTEVQRTLHEGQLMILAGVYQAVESSARRHDKQEAVIDELRKRMDRLEGSEIEA
jgi:hypothetical protein